MTDERNRRVDGRDAKGCWKKGTSGNLHGRPRNVPDLDMADVHNFSQFPTEISIGGEKQLMTRHEIVWFKMFESALKGRITAQKYLIEKFEQDEMSGGYIRLSLERWVERIADDPSSISMEDMHLLEAARDSLKLRRSTIRTRRGDKQQRN